MSLASRILGIPGLEVERVDWNQGIDVWAKPSRRPSCLHCGSKHLRIKATYKRTVKHSRQGNRVITLHLKALKYHCQDCDRYFRHRFYGIRPRFRASEEPRLEVFEAHDGLEEPDLTVGKRKGLCRGLKSIKAKRLKRTFTIEMSICCACGDPTKVAS